jgi:nucleoside-diphosphate-sugar epimerase
MRVLVIGATGYIGSVVAERLAGRGHRVVALLQAGDDPVALPPGYEVRTGDLAAPDTLTAAVGPDVDAVVHLAPPVGDAATDAAAMEALLTRLRGTGRALVYTSGLWVLGKTGPVPADEDTPVDPIDLVAYRPALERQVLAAAGDGVRAVVVRPAIAHGRGGGVPALLVSLAREHGVGRHVGGAGVTWPMVHVDDLADLFDLALAGARPGTLVHAVDEEAVPVSALAAAAARAAGVTGVEGWPLDEARAVLGTAFADALALSQVAVARRARTELGWRPWRPPAVRDLADGSYVRVPV